MFGRLAMGFANVRAGTTRVLMLVLVQAPVLVLALLLLLLMLLLLLLSSGVSSSLLQ